MAKPVMGGLGRQHWPPRRTNVDLELLRQHRSCPVLRCTCLECACSLVLRRARFPSHLRALDRRPLTGPHGLPLPIHDRRSIDRVFTSLTSAKRCCPPRWNRRCSLKNALNIAKNDAFTRNRTRDLRIASRSVLQVRCHTTKP